MFRIRPVHERIDLVVSEGHAIHHVRERGYYESPARVGAILKELDATQLFRRIPRRPFPQKHILAVHDAGFVSYLRRICRRLEPGQSVYPDVFPIRNAARLPRDLPERAGYYCIDTSTPLHHGAYRAAREAVDCTLTGADRVLQGSRLAYALVRPPGHHAERCYYGGYCYLNSAAVAAHYLSAHGRVAMLDLDYHHGNGQQDIFYERPDVLTVSIHGHPRFTFPYFSGFADERGAGPGEGRNLNLPLGEDVDGAAYRTALARALRRVKRFGPQFLIVPLGLDTAKHDPTGRWALRAPDYEANGRMVGALGLPVLVTQEGGYGRRVIGSLARRFLRGLWLGTYGR
jgi:acetoin utilization deacetylase AcuC-like enzyme